MGLSRGAESVWHPRDLFSNSKVPPSKRMCNLQLWRCVCLLHNVTTVKPWSWDVDSHSTALWFGVAVSGWLNRGSPRPKTHGFGGFKNKVWKHWQAVQSRVGQLTSLSCVCFIIRTIIFSALYRHQ